MFHRTLSHHVQPCGKNPMLQMAYKPSCRKRGGVCVALMAFLPVGAPAPPPPLGRAPALCVWDALPRGVDGWSRPSLWSLP